MENPTQTSSGHPKFRLRDASAGEGGLRPELRNATWEQIRDLIYDRGEDYGQSSEIADLPASPRSASETSS